MTEQNQTKLSAFFVSPVADFLRSRTLSGKLDEDEIERTLSANAQAILDHSMDPSDWAELRDVEGMVSLVASELGGEAGLVEWAEEVVTGWIEAGTLDALLESARALVDSQGFAVSQASALFVREPAWEYEGNDRGFSVRVRGVAEASPALKALLGGILSRLGRRVSPVSFDVRVEGVDSKDLVIFGEAQDGEDISAEGRLHRAALIP